jgi:glycosyltransferase involved in cell wall biosynthesis
MGEGEAKAVQLAVVVPFYNEGTGAAAFLERLTGALAETERASPGGLDWRVIAVNDGSADDTLGVLLRARERDARICVVDLSRNFGKEYALTAGLDRAEGDVVVVMDGDGQHPPEMLSSMLAKWREGYEVVYMVREARRVRGLHRLLDRRVVRAIGRLPERTRFLKGIYSWVGFRQTGLRYREDERVNGTSRWHFTRLFAFAMDALSAFSTLPLRLWSWIGAAVAGLSFLYAAWRVVRAIVWGIDVPGFETIVVSITFLGGMQLLSLGVLGGYIGRIFDEVKGRPLYIVRRSYGFPEDEAER